MMRRIYAIDMKLIEVHANVDKHGQVIDDRQNKVIDHRSNYFGSAAPTLSDALRVFDRATLVLHQASAETWRSKRQRSARPRRKAHRSERTKVSS